MQWVSRGLELESKVQTEVRWGGGARLRGQEVRDRKGVQPCDRSDPRLFLHDQIGSKQMH